MAKKPNKKIPAGAGKNGDAKVNKSAAIRDYLKANKKAMPKQIVAALKEKGIDVSPNMVSIIKAKSKVKRARRQATAATAAHESGARSKSSKADGLDAALAAGSASAVAGWSPMIDFAGQTAKIGQRLQPTANATGQMVMIGTPVAVVAV